MRTNRKANGAAKEIAQNCIAFRLRLVNRAITKLYNEAYRKHGVTVSQMNILVAVCRMGQVKQQAICRSLHLDKSTLSRDVVRMLERRWLRSLPGEDGRTNDLVATAEGEKLLERTMPAWLEAQRQAKALLRKEGLLGLEHAVSTLRAEK
jgi:DNA-binding MarR family transcriptional regulator